MTTIATDGRTMAGDGRITAHSEVLTDTAVKVHRLPDGRVVGVAGCSYSCIEFVRYMSEPGASRPQVDDEFTALVMHPDGRVEMMNARMVPLQIDTPIAIGSGADYATGAMLAGASPVRAVEIAVMKDSGSGGVVIEC
jgi:ATP-dependent protease HslVU (ClpYQ) peptidase subunit